ncbi:hypothetical protein [Neobacillus fumarioli]|uniref:hypothetical protein n=1 Tax=Neobacillus fumarioli TaxID=105229 RepID=UPI00082D7A9C|nr:hypothetical protein [Neobacillus fumarioli]
MPSKKTEKVKPGFLSKFIFLWLLPFIYAIALGMVILYFAGVHFDTQIKWVQDHTKILFGNKEQPAKKVASRPSGSAKKAKESAAAENRQASKTEEDRNTQTNQNNTTQSNSSLTQGNDRENNSPSNPSNTADTGGASASNNGTGSTENSATASTATTSASQLYQHMKPDQIAAILNGIQNNEEVLKQIKHLDPDTASQVLTQLNPAVAGWIVTHLNP